MAYVLLALVLCGACCKLRSQAGEVAGTDLQATRTPAAFTVLPEGHCDCALPAGPDLTAPFVLHLVASCPVDSILLLDSGKSMRLETVQVAGQGLTGEDGPFHVYEITCPGKPGKAPVLRIHGAPGCSGSFLGDPGGPIRIEALKGDLVCLKASSCVLSFRLTLPGPDTLGLELDSRVLLAGQDALACDSWLLGEFDPGTGSFPLTLWFTCPVAGEGIVATTVRQNGMRCNNDTPLSVLPADSAVRIVGLEATIESTPATEATVRVEVLVEYPHGYMLDLHTVLFLDGQSCGSRFETTRNGSREDPGSFVMPFQCTVPPDGADATVQLRYVLYDPGLDIVEGRTLEPVELQLAGGRDTRKIRQ